MQKSSGRRAASITASSARVSHGSGSTEWGPTASCGRARAWADQGLLTAERRLDARFDLVERAVGVHALQQLLLRVVVDQRLCALIVDLEPLPHGGAGVVGPLHQVAALDYTGPELLNYRYRLRGYDADWKPIEGRERRSASYTNLPPGDYVFEVEAANNAGVRSAVYCPGTCQ